MFINNLISKIKDGETVSPFLFLGKNIELVNSEVNNVWALLLAKLNIPKIYLYKLEDTWESIKLEHLKKFLEKWNLKSSYICQIFLIENIWRFTLSASNYCLKFFEEPWKWNILFLTNSSESKVLETILSRVIQINYTWNDAAINNDFYYTLIDNFINRSDYSIFTYFYKEKLESTEYILFLLTIIEYSKQNGIFSKILSCVEEDINSIKNNNVSWKFVVDKYLFKIKLKKEK